MTPSEVANLLAACWSNETPHDCSAPTSVGPAASFLVKLGGREAEARKVSGKEFIVTVVPK